EAARSVDEVRGVIRQMLDRVGQSHFALLPASVASDMNGPPLTPGEVGSLGFNVGPVGGRLVVTGVDAKGPARAAGVKPGWVLTRVGNRDVSSAGRHLSDGASDHLKDFRLWALGTSLLRGRSGEGTELGFLDERDAAVAKQMGRTTQAGVPGKVVELPTLVARLDARQVDRDGAAIGVIAFNVWMTAISRPFDEAVDRFRTAKGIVVDLRGNPGGVLTMIMGVSGHFLDGPVNLGVIKTRESSLNLVATPRMVGTAGQAVQPFSGPVAILVDSGSYSASEIFAGGMQSIGRARIFGSRQAGRAMHR